MRTLPILLLVPFGCRVTPPNDQPGETGGGDGDTHTTDDTGATNDTGATSGDPVDEHPPELSCQLDAPLLEGTLQAPYTSESDGTSYRVVQLDSDGFDELWAIVYFGLDPTATAYKDGAPVIVSAIPSQHINMTLDSRANSFFSPELGVVEVQPIYPSWQCQGHTTSGEHDSGGEQSALALKEAVRFATGEITTVDGWTLSQVAELPVCNQKVVVLAGSSGGITATLTLSKWATELSDKVYGFAAYESPSLPEFASGVTGAIWMDPNEEVDADGNGWTWDDGRNPDYRIGDCDLEDCTLDLSTLAWDPTRNLLDVWQAHFDGETPKGVFYLDRNGNGELDLSATGLLDMDGDGAIDKDEDYSLLAFEDDDHEGEPNVLYYVPQVLEAAIEADLMGPGPSWPAHLAPPDTSTAFWAERHMASQATTIAAAYRDWFRVSVIYTAIDHAQALASRPHSVVLYNAFDDAGRVARYNMAQEVALCFLEPPQLKGWPGGPPPGTRLLEGELDPYAMPESVTDAKSRSFGALGIIWDTWGPFDNCIE